MAELWHLRIHLFDGIEVEQLYAFIAKRCEVIIFVYEEHDNRPHVHILFRETQVTQSTVIQNLKKQYPIIKGNGAYSCQKCDKMKKKKIGDDEKAKAYVCKGKYHGYDASCNPIVIGVCTIDVKFYHDKYWEVNEEVKKASSNQEEVNSLLKPKAKTKSWTERVCADIIRDFEIECNTICTYYADTKPSELLIQQFKECHKIVFLYFFNCLGKGAKKINENIIRDMFTGVINFITSQNDQANRGYGTKMYKGLYPHYN
nr:MAG: hypothetical protein [Owegonang virus 21]